MQLTARERAAASALGYTQWKWDGGDEPASANKDWTELIACGCGACVRACVRECVREGVKSWGNNNSNNNKHKTNTTGESISLAHRYAFGRGYHTKIFFFAA